MGTLQSKIEELSREFADAVFTALQGANLSELYGEIGVTKSTPVTTRSVPSSKAAKALNATFSEKAKKSGRLARRSPEQIEVAITEIVACLKAHPEGMRSEQLQEALGMAKKEIASPITVALAGKKIKKTGNKRATTYFCSGRWVPAKAVKKPVAKKSTKVVKAKAATKKAPKKPMKSASKKVAKVVASPKKKSAVKKAVKAPKKKSVVKAAPKSAAPVAAVTNGVAAASPTA